MNSPTDATPRPEVETRIIHPAALEHPRPHVAHAMTPPIWQTSTFYFDHPEDAAEAGAAMRPETFYSRYGNPSFTPVQEVVADLEGAAAGLVTGSGIGAISLAFLALLESGDHVVAQRTHYVGTTQLFKRWLPRFGIEVTLVDQSDPAAFEAAIQPHTRMIHMESPVNPTMTLTDLGAVVAIAKQRDILTSVDNTFATPINQRPIEFGVDLVMHSATKYLGGHSDVVAGVVVGSQAHIDALWEALIVYGMVLHPFDAWLLLRGLKTLPMRVRQHNANALQVAEFLAGHARIARTHYPGLATHPQHELAQRQMHGYGGMVSFEIDGDYDDARRFASKLELIRRGVSLGGVETLATHAASMVFGHLSAEDRRDAGVLDNLVRLSVGLESPNDVIADLERAL